jgi:alkylation response protein AidB-like acyl-CoA dehydrogenase
MISSSRISTSVDLRLTAEQEALASSLRRQLERFSPLSKARSAQQSMGGYDTDLWDRLVGSGIAGIGIDQRFGGSGTSLTDVMVVSSELGRMLAATPYFASTVLAASALGCSADDTVQDRYLPDIAAGQLSATLWPGVPDRRRHTTARQGLTIGSEAGEVLVSGTADFVVDGATASLLLLVADSSDGTSLALVDARDARVDNTVRRRPRDVMDGTRPQATLEFANTPARLVGDARGAAAGVSAALDRAITALAAEQVGGAQNCLDGAVRYAKERVQFGKVIGSFQAVKHRCADILLSVDLAASATHYAAWCADNDPAAFPMATAVAGESASQAFLYAARECLHLHGGIGFTWEHDSHLFYRRAQASSVQFGPADFHRRLVAERCGL